MKPTLSCLKKIGPGESTDITPATANVSRTNGGTATQQQAKSSARFQPGSGLTAAAWPQVKEVVELSNATVGKGKQAMGLVDVSY
jgi:hypothetical protein